MKTLVLGSSPNAFAAAIRLAEAGQQVQLVENANHLGAPYVTLEGGEMGLAYTHFASLFQFGVPMVTHPARTALRADGSFVRLTPTALEGAYPARDGQRWPEFVALLNQAAELTSQLLSHPERPGDLLGHWRGLGRRQSMEVLRLPWMSLRDLLDEWFECESLKGLLAEAALEGVCQGPFACGTVFHLLRRWVEGFWPSSPRGGSTSLMLALQNAAERKGVKVSHSPGQATWSPGQLQLNGQTFEFDFLLSDKDVRYTFGTLVSPRYLETEFNIAVKHVRGRGVWQRGLGRWACEFPQEVRQDILHWRPGLRDLERHYDRVKRKLESDGPMQLCWPHYLDSSRPADLVQATFGYGVGSLPPEVTEVRYFTPVDYEEQWQMPQGHLWGGERDLSQSFFLRPVPAYAPELDGVDLCGASLHPGDYSGRAGYWAAERLLGSLAAR